MPKNAADLKKMLRMLIQNKLGELSAQLATRANLRR